MQVAVTGTYKNGQVILDELPPITDGLREVMVVFLPKNDAANNNLRQTDETNLLEKEGLLTMQELGGILSDYSDGVLNDEEMDEAILQGVSDRAMMVKADES